MTDTHKHSPELVKAIKESCGELERAMLACDRFEINWHRPMEQALYSGEQYPEYQSADELKFTVRMRGLNHKGDSMTDQPIDFTKATKTKCGKQVKYIGRSESKTHPYVFNVFLEGGEWDVRTYSSEGVFLGGNRTSCHDLAPPAERVEWWNVEQKVNGQWRAYGAYYEPMSQRNPICGSLGFRCRHFVTEGNNVVLCETVWENK